MTVSIKFVFDTYLFQIVVGHVKGKINYKTKYKNSSQFLIGGKVHLVTFKRSNELFQMSPRISLQSFNDE